MIEKFIINGIFNNGFKFPRSESVDFDLSIFFFLTGSKFDDGLYNLIIQMDSRIDFALEFIIHFLNLDGLKTTEEAVISYLHQTSFTQISFD